MADLVITGTTSEGVVVSFTIPEKYLLALVEGEKLFFPDFSVETLTENLQMIVDVLASQLNGIVCFPGLFSYQITVVGEALDEATTTMLALVKTIKDAKSAQQN